GVRSVYTDGKEGLTVRPGDIRDLKDKLKRLAQDRSKLNMMAKEARTKAESRYSLRSIGDKLEKTLKDKSGSK
ncbi:glycosyltransferase, partial [Candidatus Falkowbacteria bacterium]|nr:glycosyltransferase [Candidatus Falkowbacteria bacterium]